MVDQPRRTRRNSAGEEVPYSLNYKPDGFELWRGPSRLDGVDIGVVVTHIERTNPMNTKIGRMSQAWILPVATPPNDAVRSGADESVCGSCRFRPSQEGGCYVTVYSTSHRVWWAWQKFGAYTQADRPEAFVKPMRIGAWGDPFAVPLEIWEALLPSLPGWTAYTHRWRDVPEAERERWQRWCMASVDSAAERAEAVARGWRTFRARQPSDPVLEGEITCPAALEAPTHGRVTCGACELCKGQSKRAKDITIIVHGYAKTRAALALSRRKK